MTWFFFHRREEKRLIVKIGSCCNSKCFKTINEARSISRWCTFCTDTTPGVFDFLNEIFKDGCIAPFCLIHVIPLPFFCCAIYEILIFQTMMCSRSKIITIGLTLCVGVLSFGVHKTNAAALGPSEKAFNEIIVNKVKKDHYLLLRQMDI